MTAWARFLAWRSRDRELAEEIQGHLEEKIEELVESGLSVAEATHAARRAFGNVTLTNERGRAVWGRPIIDTWWSDVRYGLRRIRTRPGIAAVAMLSTAFSMAAAALTCAVVYGVLLDPYPYRDVSRMVHLHVFGASGFLFDLPLSSDEFQALQRSPVVDDAMAMDMETMALTDGDLPEPVNVGFLSPTAFSFLGVPPLLGRVFAPDDANDPVRPRQVAVLSYRYWRAHFAGQPDVVGRALLLDHQRYDVVGVMPRRFAWWSGDVYLPLKQSADPDRLATVVVRLRPGVSDARGEQAIEALVSTFAKTHPGHVPAQFQIHAVPMADIAAGPLAGTLRAISAAVGLLLLIGCANVSILLMAQGATRARELAIRVALGASRGRLVRQLLTESLLITLGGTIAGLILAGRLVDVIPRLLPDGALPAEAVIRIGAPVLIASAGMAILAGALAGLWPAVRCAHAELPTFMRLGSRQAAPPATNRSHSTLIATQVALTIVLLAGAGATARAVIALLHRTLNYDPQQVASVSVDLRDGTYTEWGRRVQYYEHIRDAVADAPGIVSAAVSLSDLPPTVPFRRSAVQIAGRPDDTASENRHAALVTEISPEYFATLGIPFVSGQPWTVRENQRATPVAVINASMARRDWPDGDPLRQWIRLPDLKATNTWSVASEETNDWLQVVGVAADVPNNGLNEPVAPAVYVPFTLVVGDSLRLITRGTDQPATVARLVAQTVHALDTDQPITQVHTAEEVLEAQGWARERLTATLFGALAALALLLSSAGLYSVVSYVVAQRRHDFSVRVALGARRSDLIRLVLSNALEPTMVGVAGGLALTLIGSTLLARWTHATVRDPYVLVPIVVLLLAVTTLAALVPAYRGASRDPMAGLRAE